MKHQKKQTIILLIILLVCIGCYLLFRFSSIFENKEEVTTEYPIWEVDSRLVTHISFEGQEEHLEFNKQGDSWTYTGDSSCVINSSAIENLLRVATQLTATEKITNVTDFDQYGFAEPSNTVVFKAEGIEYTIYYGNYNSLAGGYYVMVNDDVFVYVIESPKTTSYSKTIDYFLVKEEISGNDDE